MLRLAARLLLAGREELLAAVDDRLAGSEDQGPRVVALHGLGGAGKTSLAVEYAYRHMSEVGVAWQLPAEDATVLAAGFAELAAQLGAHQSGGDPVAAVHSALAAYLAPWLLIFDNAPGRGAGAAVLAAGRERPGADHQPKRVLAAGPGGAGPAARPEVAAVFLVNRTGDPASRAAAELASELGGLPLALEQAAAYIQTSGITLARYLSLFLEREADLLARGQAAGHPADVAATLVLALSRLEDEAPAAAGLLRLLACLAPEPVPLALLLANVQIADQLAPEVAVTVGPLLGDPVAVGDAVVALRRLLAGHPGGRRPGAGAPAGAGRHRRPDARGVREGWRAAAAALIEAAIPADTARPDLAGVRGAAAARPGRLARESGGMARLAITSGAAAATRLPRPAECGSCASRPSALSTRTP